MCGIAGYVNTDGRPASAAIVAAMAAAIAHRGPDGEGAWAEGAVALGHRRLAIIDLSAAAAQPMSTADRRLTITYNGEIYNYRELRSELQQRGHTFRSTSDTEVLLAAYAEWGQSALLKLNGMFAFALWDAERRELVLARDRFGVKPLYYGERGGVVAFGSEIKALFKHPAIEARLCQEGLVEYFTFQNFFTTKTLFDDVRLLAPGTIMVVRPSRGDVAASVVQRQYWDYALPRTGKPSIRSGVS